MLEQWNDLSRDNRTTIIVIAIIACTVIAVGFLVFLGSVLMQAGI